MRTEKTPKQANANGPVRRRPPRHWCAYLAALLCAAVLGGCVSPRTPAATCTVLLEDNAALSFSRQICEVRQGQSVSVTVGVPTGQRIASVNYDDYSLSLKTGSSASFDYYTLTLHRVRYSAVIRITTAPSYITRYHVGDICGEDIEVQEDSPHLYPNTLAYRAQFSREGYVPIGWNTAADGSGTHIGFGSRFDRREAAQAELYPQWLAASPAEDFAYRIEDGAVTITAYFGGGDVVIPQTMAGLPVTAVASGAFGDLAGAKLVFPPTLKRVEAGAFGNVRFAEFYFFDSIELLTEASFTSYSFGSIHIQAAVAPVYTGSYFGTLADKLDYLDSLRDTQKLVLFCGSSARFGYDSAMLEEAFPAYRVANMGVYAYSNMLPQAQLVLRRMGAGDVLLSSPELDAIDKQFCGEASLDREFFCMMEANYDLFAELDSSGYTDIFDAFSEFLRSRAGMTPGSYADSPAYYDEDGNAGLTHSYNRQGDYILYRPDNDARKCFGVKRAYYNPAHVRETDLLGLNRVYDAFAEKGVAVLFTYSPRSSISISQDSTAQTIAALDELLRTELHATVISSIDDSLMDPYYFYGTDNHLSTQGVAVHTRRIIEDLRAAWNGGAAP